MPKYSLILQRFPYGGREDSECVDWLMETYHRAKLDKRFGRVVTNRLNDTPITMTRNAALVAARRQGYDFMVMVDSDMAPDAELLAGDTTAKPFFETAVDYALASPKPCVIAAPYLGAPPHENVFVFQWCNLGGTKDPTAANAILQQYTREHAAILSGVQPVAALPTGLMLIDLRALDKLPHPYTYYEYKGAGPTECDACHQKTRGPETEKASTEDVTFTRDLGLLGVPILCAWDSWAGHNKRYTSRKPRPYTTDVVAAKMREAIGRNVLAGEQEIIVQEPDWLADHERTLAAADAELARLVAGRNNNGYDPKKPLEIDQEAFLRPERGTVGWPSAPEIVTPVRPTRGIVEVVNAMPQGIGPQPLTESVFHTNPRPAPVNDVYAAPPLLPTGTQIPVQVVGPDNVTRVVPGTVRDGRVVADACSTVPPAGAAIPAPGVSVLDVEAKPQHASSQPWTQHIPAAAGEALTPLDLLAGVPLG